MRKTFIGAIQQHCANAQLIFERVNSVKPLDDAQEGKTEGLTCSLHSRSIPLYCVTHLIILSG